MSTRVQHRLSLSQEERPSDGTRRPEFQPLHLSSRRNVRHVWNFAHVRRPQSHVCLQLPDASRWVEFINVALGRDQYVCIESKSLYCLFDMGVCVADRNRAGDDVFRRHLLSL